jgi:hypothetical protein
LYRWVSNATTTKPKMTHNIETPSLAFVVTASVDSPTNQPPATRGRISRSLERDESLDPPSASRSSSPYSAESAARYLARRKTPYPHAMMTRIKG